MDQEYERSEPSDLEDRLRAYVDGAMSGAEAQEIEALLETSSTAQRLLDLLLRESEGLRALFDAEQDAMAATRPIELPPHVPDEPPTISIGDRLTRLFERSKPAWAAPAGLAAVGGLALGLLVSGALPTRVAVAPDAPGWRMSAAVYQRLYAEETFASAPVAERDVAVGLATLADSLSIDLSRLTEPDGLRLERAQLLRFNGRALGQIAFLDADGVPIALCFMKRRDDASDGSAAQTFAESRLLDLNAVDWSDGDHDFLLLGAASPDALRFYAKRFFEQLG